MKKLFLKFITALIFLYPITGFSQQDLAHFQKVASQDGFPPVCERLDSLLETIYKNTGQGVNLPTYLNEMDNNALLEHAKTLIAFYQFPKAIEHKYIKAANTPFDEVSRQTCNNHHNRQIKPGSALLNIKKEIFKRLPWEWEFHIKNRYIFVVRVTNTEIRSQSSCSSSPAPFYTCEIVNDIKGNYKGSQQIEFIGNHIKGSMETGKEYLILVWGECIVKDKPTGIYLLRGHATNGEAIFPVINNSIIDTNSVLKQGVNEIIVDSYKSELRSFIYNATGAVNEN